MRVLVVVSLLAVVGCVSPLARYKGLRSDSDSYEDDYRTCESLRGIRALDDVGRQNRACYIVSVAFERNSPGWWEFVQRSCARGESDGCTEMAEATVPAHLQSLADLGWSKADSPDRFEKCRTECGRVAEEGDKRDCATSCGDVPPTAKTNDRNLLAKSRDALADFCLQGSRKQWGARSDACLSAAMLTAALDGPSQGDPAQPKTGEFPTPPRSIDLAMHACDKWGEASACLYASRRGRTVDLALAAERRRALDEKDERENDAIGRRQEALARANAKDRAAEQAAPSSEQRGIITCAAACDSEWSHERCEANIRRHCGKSEGRAPRTRPPESGTPCPKPGTCANRAE